MKESKQVGPIVEPLGEALKILLEAEPVEMRADLERFLRKTEIKSDDDPLIPLMVVLKLYAAYYNTIPSKIADAGKAIDAQNKNALTSLDSRVSALQAFAVIIQKATDRLERAPQEIATKFPAQKLAEQLKTQIESELNKLKIGEFEQAVNRSSVRIETFVTQGDERAKQLDSIFSRIQKTVEGIKEMELPYVSWWRDVGFVFGGALAAAFLMWWFVVRAEQQQISDMIQTQGFIGSQVQSGTNDNGTFLIIEKDQISVAQYNDARDLVVYLKKKPEAGN